MSKIIALTGASGGLGQVMTQEFIKKGHHVIGIDLDAKKLNEMEEQYLNDFTPFIVNLLDGQGTVELYEKIYDEFGAPDIWINNAGVSGISPFLEMKTKHFNEVMEINFQAPAFACHYWLPKMKMRGSGQVVNMASVAGHVSPPFLSAYVASKHALVGLSESIQNELYLEKSPVKLTIVSPGFVQTDIIQLGHERGFPEWMSFMLSTPQTCGKKIVKGILKGEELIEPTLNGKVMMGLNRLLPTSIRPGSRALAAKNWRQLLGLEKINF